MTTDILSPEDLEQIDPLIKILRKYAATEHGKRAAQHAEIMQHIFRDTTTLANVLEYSRAAWAEIERLKDALYQAEADRTVALDIARTITDEKIERGARALCKSRSFEGFNCCQWPANRGRTQCPVRDGGYDDGARAVLEAVKEGG